MSDSNNYLTSFSSLGGFNFRPELLQGICAA